MTLDVTKPIKVLDHGKVELLETFGSDLAIVQAAQSSFSKFSLKFGDRERGILGSLMREEHGVPFERAALSFRIDMPIFVARQLVKHRMSSWSEKSARYSMMDISFYMPDPADVRSNVGRPMLYQFEQVETERALEYLRRLQHFHELAEMNYAWCLENHISREQARFFLPVTLYTTVTWTMNMRGFLNMLHLRNDPHAQEETRMYAIAMERLAAAAFPETIKLFNSYGRKVP